MTGIKDWTGDIHQGDAASLLAAMPADSVHMAMCSPPYYGLRDYEVDGQIGLEDSLGAYIDSHPVACPDCGDEVDAQVALFERACPACGVGYRVFFEDAPDPEAAAIAYPFDGPAEVRAG